MGNMYPGSSYSTSSRNSSVADASSSRYVPYNKLDRSCPTIYACIAYTQTYTRLEKRGGLAFSRYGSRENRAGQPSRLVWTTGRTAEVPRALVRWDSSVIPAWLDNSGMGPHPRPAEFQARRT